MSAQPTTPHSAAPPDLPRIERRAKPDDAMRNTLIRRAAKAAERRFTGEPITGFGGLQ